MKPPDASLGFQFGLELFQRDRLAEAETVFLDVLRMQPSHFEALYLLGVIAVRSGRLEPAAELFRRAVAVNPGHAELRSNLGYVLEALGRLTEALPHYERAVALEPGNADAQYNRGNVLGKLERHAEAVPCYDRAIAARPGFALAYYNRGNSLRDLGQWEAALASFDQAIALAPGVADAHNNRGNTLRDLGRDAESVLSFDAAIGLDPDDPEPYWNRSLSLLAMGDYERGWEAYERRWKSRNARARGGLPGAPWLGETPLDGRTIVVHAEQGLGDTLQFCRYAPMLGERATVVLDVPRPLVRLLSGLRGVASVVATGDALPAFDAWIPMMSLPLAFHTTVATIPASIPYLHADPEQVDVWRQRLSGFTGRKIGLVWSGSPRPGQPDAHAIDRRRSITLEHYAPLAGIPGLCLISLQKGEGAARAKTPPAGMVLHDWTEELDDFADTAALIEALDLVISVDTSVVHLAGALGKPVWVLNRFDQCWRWLRGRADSPWYPTARLFHQRAPGEWAEVIREVAGALLAGE